jgi:hypothetical protein
VQLGEPEAVTKPEAGKGLPGGYTATGRKIYDAALAASKEGQGVRRMGVQSFRSAYTLEGRRGHTQTGVNYSVIFWIDTLL